MIKYITYLISLILICIMLSGCGGLLRMKPRNTVPMSPPGGILYSSVKAPLTVDFNGNPTGQDVKKFSYGETNWFWIPLSNSLEFGFGEVDLESIARKGNIEKVSYADYELTTIIFIYSNFKINVYGN